jgi:hypothetical protein
MVCCQRIQYSDNSVNWFCMKTNEVMEAIWVAAEMRAGGAYAHSVIALDQIESGNGSSN